MFEKIVFLLVILICTIRVISYGIYTVKDKNIVGAVGLFVMAFCTAASSICFFIN